jgi:Arc/MetJ family transcription regulator
MRTNIVIDDQLMTRAIKLGGFRTKKSAIEAGLHLLVQMYSQKKLRGLRGKVKWEGNLEEMRTD